MANLSRGSTAGDSIILTSDNFLHPEMDEAVGTLHLFEPGDVVSLTNTAPTDSFMTIDAGDGGYVPKGTKALYISIYMHQQSAGGGSMILYFQEADSTHTGTDLAVRMVEIYAGFSSGAPGAYLLDKSHFIILARDGKFAYRRHSADYAPSVLILDLWGYYI